MISPTGQGGAVCSVRQRPYLLQAVVLVESNERAVNDEDRKQGEQSGADGARAGEPTQLPERQRGQGDVRAPCQSKGGDGEVAEDPAQSQREQEGHAAVESAEREQHHDEDHRHDQLLEQREVVGRASEASAAGVGLEEGGLGDSVAQGAVRADSHAVQILEAGRVDDHAVLLDLLMHAHAAGAGRGAGSALGTLVGHANAARRQTIGRAEEDAVGAAVVAEASRA